MTTVAQQPPMPPQVEGFWLTQSALPIARDFIGWLDKNRLELGNIYYAGLRIHHLLVCVEPEAVKYVLQDNNRNYRKSFGYDILKLFLGKGLLTSEGDFWIRQRRLAQPAFHKKRLANLLRFMQEESGQLAEEWQEKAASGARVDLKHEMLEVTMKIVARALFSANVVDDIQLIGTHLERLNVFAVKRIQSPIRLPMWLPTLRAMRFRESSQAINSVIFRIIEERRRNLGVHDDLLEMLIEARDADTGEQMTDEQLRDECMTIFVAGHETTAISMTWLFYELARHPEVLHKLEAELDRELGGKAPEMEDLPRLRYTRAVIDEALRLYPPGWLVGRQALEDDTIGGFHVPKGTNVLLSTYLIHRRPDLWERPNDFWPERWETDRVKDLHRMAYFPFGGGPRLCIGNNFALMEMTVLVATLVQQFRVRLLDREPVPPKPLITLHPGAAIPVQLELR